ncbi:DEAD/DEAH box helicase [Conexibacter sp. SYSU D00693]|uniref:DEAD/DEAH box helicase n=1 Tax=Conexibacter sp. SYSU D00693 TaxID=2812560 RepID=UPI00196A6AB0|nr:DEAD/DEAH box helicase [Conexibacter sp. SYSU D00693]
MTADAEPAASTSQAADPTSPTTFADLGLRDELIAAVTALGYEEPTPIQREAIEPLAAGRDLLGQAATGTGKTAAFALPMLQRLERGREDRRPMGLVLVPTRELAVQVSEAAHKYGRGLAARVVPIYGGQPMRRQLRELQDGVDVVVATPGRALDHVKRRTLVLDAVEVVVLDEADEMLDMGFAEDLEALLAAAPERRQTVLFSATMPPRLERIAQGQLRDPVRLTVGREAPAPGEAPLVRETAHMVARAHKPAALGRVLDVEAPTAALVFCRTRDEVDQLTESLNGRGHRAEALHGGLSQEQRDRVMGRLRAGAADLLVATDVAARGLDVEQLTHVVNYDVPASPEAYVHRIGRVGRAGREGAAITLAEPREHRLLKAIERVTRRRIPVERLPTVADLRARRMELTRSGVEEALADGELEPYRAVLDALVAEHDLVDVALAAIRLAHEATGAGVEDEPEEIPDVPARKERRERGPGGPRGDDRRSAERRGDGDRGGGDRGPAGPTARIFIGAGRAAGVRPQDLVGAITGETRLQGSDIGAIHIAERFALVEVPEPAADFVVRALRQTKIKGQKPTIRRDREEAPPPRAKGRRTDRPPTG